MSVRTYDPKQVIITIGGVAMSGFADGTFLEVQREEDAFTKVVGADGYTTRTKSNNRSGSITLTLKQSSPSNDILSGYALLDEATSTAVLPIFIKDLSGSSIYFSAQGWVKKFPNSTFGKDLDNREWTIDCADFDQFVGSNANT